MLPYATLSYVALPCVTLPYVKLSYVMLPYVSVYSVYFLRYSVDLFRANHDTGWSTLISPHPARRPLLDPRAAQSACCMTGVGFEGTVWT